MWGGISLYVCMHKKGGCIGYISDLLIKTLSFYVPSRVPSRVICTQSTGYKFGENE